MGFVHHHTEPIEETGIAEGLPALADREVEETAVLAEAYAGLRSALLALSGVSLMQQLGRADPSALAGVVLTARQCLDGARAAAGRPIGSRHDGVRRRAAELLEAVDALEGEVSALRRQPTRLVAPEPLEAARRVTARTALPQAGMRHFSSVSCAGYPGDAELVTAGHHHPHAHPHHH